MDRFVPNTLPFSRRQLPIRTILSYAFDYGIIVVLAALYFIIDIVVTPFNQPFSLTNTTLQYPFAVKERIPIPMAMVLCVIVPMLIIATYSLLIDGIFSHRRQTTGARWSEIYRLKDRLWELNCGILGIFLAIGAAFVITGSLKNLVGKPRPDLLARCQPEAGSVDALVFGLSNSTICTQTDKFIMADGFRSFPSGHSSAAFAGLFFLSLYLAGKLHILDNRGEVWRSVIVLIPTLAASCVAASRIMDARHHPFDVLFGSALGILVAWGSYRQYFPPLTEPWKKGRAYPIRTWGAQMKAPPESLSRDMVQHDGGMPPSSAPDGRMAGIAGNLDGQSSGYGKRSSGNVFRDQISQSQRRRQGHAHPDVDVDVAPAGAHTKRTTVDGAEYTSPRHRDHDEDWSTNASSDEENGGADGRARRGDPESFEMSAAHARPLSSGDRRRSLPSRQSHLPGVGSSAPLVSHQPILSSTTFFPRSQQRQPPQQHQPPTGYPVDTTYGSLQPSDSGARSGTSQVAQTGAVTADANTTFEPDEDSQRTASGSAAYRNSLRQAEAAWSPIEQPPPPHPGERALT